MVTNCWKVEDGSFVNIGTFNIVWLQVDFCWDCSLSSSIWIVSFY
jgi:hypothetical protein